MNSQSSFLIKIGEYNIIIMSMNVILPPIQLDDAKIRRMGAKYAKFKARQSQQKQQSLVNKWVTALVQRCSSCWNRLIPPSIRDFNGEFEQFNHCWRTQMGKPCSNVLISRLSLEENLLAYTVGRPAVIALVYSPQSIQKILNFVNHLQVEQLKSEVIICPINIEGRLYRQQIEPKIVIYDETIAIFWRGLFNEMILLSKLRIHDFSLFKSIKEQVNARIEYEARIKDCSEVQKFNETNSQVLMN